METGVTSNSAEPWLLPFSAAELARAVALLAAEIAPARGVGRPGVIELNILDDHDMSTLNKNFMGLGGPTNVLSFPACGGRGSAASLALAVQTVCREAWLYGQEPGRYTLGMLAHGLAHVLGYEHGAAMDAQVERAVEKIVAVFANDGNCK